MKEKYLVLRGKEEKIEELKSYIKENHKKDFMVSEDMNRSFMEYAFEQIIQDNEEYSRLNNDNIDDMATELMEDKDLNNVMDKYYLLVSNKCADEVELIDGITESIISKLEAKEEPKYLLLGCDE